MSDDGSTLVGSRESRGSGGRRLSFRTNFAWTAAGNVYFAATQGAMLVVLARMLSAAAVGRFALALAVTAPIVALAQLRLPDIEATDAKRDYPFAAYGTLTVVNALLAMLVIFGVSLVLGYRGEVLVTIMVVGVAKNIESVSWICYGLQQRNERMDRMGRSLLARGTLSLAGMAMAVYVTDGLVWGVVGMMVGYGIVLVLFDLPAALQAEAPSGIHSLRGLRLRKLALLALPLGFSQLLVAINPSAPRLFLERYVGEVELGVFAALAYIVVALSMVSRALAQAAAPRLGQSIAEADGRATTSMLRKQVQIAAAIGGLSVIGSFLVGERLLLILYGSEYAAQSTAFVAFMCFGVLLFVSMQLTQGLIAARRLNQLTALLAFTVMVTLVAGAIWIPKFGIGGAVAVLLASGAVRLVGSVILMRRTIARLAPAPTG